MQIHKSKGDLCWVAECASSAEVKDAIEAMIDIGLRITEVHPFRPFAPNQMQRDTEGQLFIVVGIAKTML